MGQDRHGPHGRWRIEQRAGRLWVLFEGIITPEVGRESATAFVRACGDHAEHIVFDVREVRAYSNAARKAWQSAVWPIRHRIASLSVLSTSQLTRMGAHMFAMFLGLECHVARSQEELQSQLGER